MKRLFVVSLVAGIVAASCASSEAEDLTERSEATTTTAAVSAIETRTGEVTTTLGSTTLGSTTAGVPTEVEAPWRLDELLGWVTPPAQDLESVFMIDLRRAALQLGIQVDCSDDDKANDYIVGFARGAHHFPFLWRDARTGASAFEVEFGLSICDATAAVDARSSGVPSAWLVDLPEGQVVAALESDPIWSSELERASYGDREVFRWGNSPVGDLDRVSAARPGGYGGQVIVDGDVFVRSSNERALHALLDAQNASGTLADYGSVRDLLAYMDQAGAHSALLYRSLEVEPPIGLGSGWDSLRDQDNGVLTRPKLDPYEFFVLTLGANGGTDEVAFVVLNRDEAAAVDNTTNLQSVLEEGARISGGPDARWVDDIDGAVSYETDGRLSIATFAAERSNDQYFFRWTSAIERDGIRWHISQE